MPVKHNSNFNGFTQKTIDFLVHVRDNNNVCNRGIDRRLFSHHLINDLMTGFDLISDFYRYLYKVRDM